MERRIVAQLLTCMDDLGNTAPPAAGSKQALAEAALAAEEGGGPGGPEGRIHTMKSVMVIGATNRLCRPRALHSCLLVIERLVVLAPLELGTRKPKYPTLATNPEPKIRNP